MIEGFWLPGLNWLHSRRKNVKLHPHWSNNEKLSVDVSCLPKKMLIVVQCFTRFIHVFVLCMLFRAAKKDKKRVTVYGDRRKCSFIVYNSSCFTMHCCCLIGVAHRLLTRVDVSHSIDIDIFSENTRELQYNWFLGITVRNVLRFL